MQSRRKTLRLGLISIIAVLTLFQTGTAAALLHPAAEESHLETAEVVVDGNVLFSVAGGKIFPAERRAREITQRIKRLAKDPHFDPATLQLREQMGMLAIVAGDQTLMAVLAEDMQVIGLTETPIHIIARELYLKKIVQSIQSYRAERSSVNLLKNGWQALLRTAILAVSMFTVFWIFRKFDVLLERYVKSRIEKLEAKSHYLLDSRQIWAALQKALRGARAVFMIALIYVFLNFVLSLFPWTHHVAQTLMNYVTKPLLIMLGATLDNLPNLFFLIVLVLVVRYVLKLTLAFFTAIGRRQLRFAGFDAEWALPTYRIARLFVVLLSLVVAYPYIPGSDSEAFKGISLLFGLLLSLGSTSIISNIVAGYSITYRRAFKVGDMVKIGNHIGEIIQIRMLVTNLRSLKNEMVVIPNSVILNNEIVNYSALASSQGLILHTAVGIGYEVPWRQVESMLLMAAERTPGLLPVPKPFVLQTALGDFAITYELNFFCANPEKMVEFYAEVHRNIQDVFNEYDVQIMTPHYEGDPVPPKTVPREKWHMAPAPATRPKIGKETGING